MSAPLTAGKCLSVVLDLGGVEGGGDGGGDFYEVSCVGVCR